MRKKLFFKSFLFVVFATFVTFTACKDYDDDIDKLEDGLANLKTTVENMQQKIESGSTIESVDKTNNGITIKLSDGKTYSITNGVDGKDGSTVTIGGNGNWFIDGKDTGKASKGTDGKDGKDGKDGVVGKDGIYYTPGEDGFWYKVDGDNKTKTDDRWLVEGTITAKLEDGYVLLYNVEGSAEPIAIGLISMNNLVLVTDYVTEDDVTVLNFDVLVSSDENDILQTTAKYQVSPTNASEQLIDKDNIYFKVNNPTKVTRATSDLNAKAEFVSLKDGILTITASIDANALEVLEEGGDKIVQLMLVVPLTTGYEVVSDLVPVTAIGVEEIVPELSVTPETLDVIGVEGDDITLTVDSKSDAWEISELPDWITEKEKTATSITLAVAPNDGDERTASIKFNLVNYPTVTQTVEVTQEEFVEPTLDVPASETGLSIALEGDNVKIDVASNFDWTYTITDDWITVVNKTDTELELTVAKNDGPQRVATIVFTTESTPALTKEVIITQLSTEPVIIFKEDFEWLAPWADAENLTKDTGDTVGDDDPGVYSPQIPTPKIDGESAHDALLEKGYEFLRVTPETTEAGECIYLQRNYLKFGKTGFQAGIILPKLEEDVPTGLTPVMSFDWCPQRQGSGVIDPVNLIVIITNGDEETIFEIPESGFEQHETLRWIEAKVVLTGVELTKETKITIRQSNWQLPSAHRYFLDNIEIRLEQPAVGGGGNIPSLPPKIW